MGAQKLAFDKIFKLCTNMNFKLIGLLQKFSSYAFDISFKTQSVTVEGHKNKVLNAFSSQIFHNEYFNSFATSSQITCNLLNDAQIKSVKYIIHQVTLSVEDSLKY